MSPSAPRTALAVFLLALPGLVACGGDDDDGGAADAAPTVHDAAPAIDAAPDPDAATAALDCAGDALPTTAAANVTIAGATNSIVLGANGPMLGAIGGVSISAFAVDGDELLAGPVVSDPDDGSFEITAATDGVPMDGYFRAELEGYKDSYLYPQFPVFQNLEEAAMPIFTEQHLTVLSGLAQVVLEEGNGQMVVVVIDCNGDPVEGATVSAGDGAQIVYLSGEGFPDSDRTTTSTQGVALVFNVAPGEVVLDANRGDVTWRDNDVEAYADSITATLLAP